MNAEQLDKRHVLLNEQLSKIRARIAEVSLKLLTVPVDEVTPLISESGRLHNEEAGLLQNISNIRLQMIEAEKAEKAALGLKRTKEILTEFEKVKANPPKCADCGKTATLITDPAQPQFRVQGLGWTAPRSANGMNWWVSVYCKSCGVLWNHFPEKPLEEDEE